MKIKRIVVNGTGVYHVFNRTAYARYTLNDMERDVFVQMMRKQAVFCGIQVLCFCVMSNHYHMLVRVPRDRHISDAELLSRYRALYKDDPAPRAALRPSELEAILAADTDQTSQIRKQICSRMHRLPVFMKELQQRFGIWYNTTHENKGTLWSERFRSVLVENDPRVMRIVGAYIELNPVRAGMVERPEAYRWCSLAAALKGEPQAQEGIRIVTGYRSDYHRALSIYVRHIYGVCDHRTKPGTGAVMPADAVELPNDLPSQRDVSAIHGRVAAFTQGTILGTVQFVQTFLVKQARLFGLRPKSTAVGHRVLRDGEVEFCTLRKCNE